MLADLPNTSPSGKDTKATFKDVNLGLIAVKVPASLVAKCVPDGHARR
jgi:hypothetical protein